MRLLYSPHSPATRHGRSTRMRAYCTGPMPTPPRTSRQEHAHAFIALAHSSRDRLRRTAQSFSLRSNRYSSPAKDVQNMQLFSQNIKRAGNLLRGRSELGGKTAKMSLLELGNTIWGGTEKIVAYMRQNNLLATAKNCSRYIINAEDIGFSYWCACRVLHRDYNIVYKRYYMQM